jgi:hypothetical protein
VLAGCRAVFDLQPPIEETTDARAADGTLDPDAQCDPGYKLEGGACVDVDECATSTSGCSSNAACTNNPGSYTCACNPGFDGNGMTCTKRCNTVLIYADCPEAGSSCSAVQQATYLTNAATKVGLVVQIARTTSEFNTMYDAGGFELLVVDASRTSFVDTSASRTATWVTADKPTIVTFWDLDNSTTGATLRNALGVNTGGNFATPRDVYYDAAGGIDLFNRIEQVTSPMTFANVMADDNDVLTLAGAGRIAARFQSTTGTGALALTHGDKAITLGYLLLEATHDDDSDGKPDAQEMYTNMMGYLCGY